jgi:hypothetical protein
MKKQKKKQQPKPNNVGISEQHQELYNTEKCIYSTTHGKCRALENGGNQTLDDTRI